MSLRIMCLNGVKNVCYPFFHRITSSSSFPITHLNHGATLKPLRMIVYVIYQHSLDRTQPIHVVYHHSHDIKYDLFNSSSPRISRSRMPKSNKICNHFKMHFVYHFRCFFLIFNHITSFPPPFHFK